jgi:hypothetical protein
MASPKRQRVAEAIRDRFDCVVEDGEDVVEDVVEGYKQLFELVRNFGVGIGRTAAPLALSGEESKKGLVFDELLQGFSEGLKKGLEEALQKGFGARG